jgi:hypothetical protein
LSLTPGNIRHLHLGDAQPVPSHTRVADTAHAWHEAVAPDSVAPDSVRAPTPARTTVTELGGFSGALRRAGPMASLTPARALLDALESLARSQPAA